jgi:hypothetical protein
MPGISKFKCDKCSLEFHPGWGGIGYVEDYDGNRVILTHPLETPIIERTLNIERGLLDSRFREKLRWWWPRKRKEDYKRRQSIYDAAQARRGFLSDCICLDCLEKQELDLKKDERECRSCSSSNVKSVMELLGSICPKCKEGIIKEFETGIMS